MPLYEYECTTCHKKTEKIESVAGPHLKKCPHCGGKVERLLGAPAIQFKGAGWYVTDYAGKKNAPEGTPAEKGTAKEGAKEESSTKESSAKESGSKESASKEPKEQKPAKK